MNKNSLIQLTTNLYKLTLLFPKKEPLRYKIRESADKILAGLVSINKNTSLNQKEELLENLEILDSFFAVAKAQNWVSPSQLLEIQKEYSKIKEELEPQLKISLPETTLSTEKQTSFEVKKSLGTKESVNLSGNVKVIERNKRQEKILEILKEKEKAQVGEFKKIFPEVTKRTLRRDFEQLLKRGLIKRIGERNETFYQLRGGT